MHNHHSWIIAPYRLDRQLFFASQKREDHTIYSIDCHKRLRGPYTATGELLRRLVPEIFPHHPELVLAHTVEILSIAPELKTYIPARVETLTSLAIPRERTRFYSRTRTLRLTHGLIDFLLAALSTNPDSHTVLYFEHVHQADTLDQEFLATLLRRAKTPAIELIIATDDQQLPDSLGEALNTYTRQFRLEPPTHTQFAQQLAQNTIPPHWQQWLLQHSSGWSGEWSDLAHYQDLLHHLTPQGETLSQGLHHLVQHIDNHDQLAHDYITAEGISENPLQQEAYMVLDRVTRQRWHDERAQELEKANQWTLHLGAIAYHYEHGQNPSETGAHALQEALDYCINLGFYEATIDLGYRGRNLIDKEKQLNYYWIFTTKITTSLAALERAEEAETLYNEARALTSILSVHMQAAYATSMLYTRHHNEQKRNFILARGWINEAIGIAQSLPDQKERIFNTVFNQNGLALIEHRLGNHQKALDLVSEGLRQLDTMFTQDEHALHRSVLRYNRAQVYASAQQLAQALEDYTQVIAADPMYSEYYFDRGNLYRRLGRDQEALADYEHAIEFSPPYLEAYYNRASILLLQERKDEALADYHYVLELDPDYLDALINRASILYEKEDYQAAYADVQHGLSLDKHNAQMLCLQGLLYTSEGNTSAAQQAFSAALDQDASLVAAWSNRAILAFEQGDNEAALSDLTRALELGEDATILYNRGMAYKEKQQWEDAIADFTRALALSEQDQQDLLYQRGHCYAAIDKKEYAHQDFEHHLKLGNSPHRDELLAFDSALTSVAL